MKDLYLFVSSTKTGVAKTVSFFTFSNVTHSAISLDPTLSDMPSFGRFTLKLFPNGHTHENIRKNVLKKYEYCQCRVLKTKINDTEYEGVKRIFDEYEKEKEKYKYAVLGAFMCAFRIKSNFKYKRFCSQFVADVLSRGVGLTLPYHVSLMRPKDFLNLKEFHEIYSGTISDLSTGIDNGTIRLDEID